jgi:hypothetical protein
MLQPSTAFNHFLRRLLDLTNVVEEATPEEDATQQLIPTI